MCLEQINGIISNLKAWKSEKDNGTITYSATVNGEDSENYGISIDKRVENLVFPIMRIWQKN